MMLRIALEEFTSVLHSCPIYKIAAAFTQEIFVRGS